MYDEKLLLKQATEGDHIALGNLYKAHMSQGISIAGQYVKNRQDAEDVYQEAFLKAMAHLDTFDARKNFASWLHVIIVNTAKDMAAKKDNSAVSSFSSMSSEEDDTPYEHTLVNVDQSVVPEAVSEAQALHDIMGEILGELPKEQREAVVLFYYKEMSVKQIAELQQVSEDTVKSRLNYSRKKVKAGVDAYEKKHNIALHSIGVTPLLVIFFLSAKGKAYASTIGIATGTAASATGAAVGTATAAGTATAGAATAAGTTASAGAAVGIFSSLGVKVAAIAGAVLLAGGTVTGLAVGMGKNHWKAPLVAEADSQNEDSEKAAAEELAGQTDADAQPEENATESSTEINTENNADKTGENSSEDEKTEDEKTEDEKPKKRRPRLLTTKTSPLTRTLPRTKRTARPKKILLPIPMTINLSIP